MKVLSFLTLLLGANLVFAQDVLNCSVKIADNKVRSNAKDLKSSTLQITADLSSNPDIKEDYHIDRIIAYPGQKQTDRYLIRVFRDDTRDQEIAESKSIPLSRLQTEEKLTTRIYSSGIGITAYFETNTSNYTLNIYGKGLSGKHTFILYSRFNYLEKDRAMQKIAPLIVSCQRVPQEIINENEIKKGESIIQKERNLHEEARRAQQK